MNSQYKKALQWVGTGVGAILAGVVLMLSATMVAYPAISSIAGLAVAQTSTLWNNVKDAAAGDGLTSGILAQSPMLYNGLSFDRMKSAPASDANAATGIAADMTLVYNGTTYDRMRGGLTTDTNAATGLLNPGLMIFNGTTWDRVRIATADALASTGIQTGNVSLFNGTTFDRQDGVSATNNTATTTVGVTYSASISTWSVTDTDVGATQSIASKAAGGGTVRHVATSVTLCRGDTVAAVPALINLRDGATGAGTIIRSWVIGVSAINESRCVDLAGLNMTGTANTAMTLEFAAAGSATSTSTVTLTGYSTP